MLSSFQNYTHKFCFLIPLFSRTKPCNSFWRMRNEIRFLRILTEIIYAILNLEFINSLEHRMCYCDVTCQFWVNLHPVALKLQNPLLETCTISETIVIPLESLFLGTANKIMNKFFREILGIPTITLKSNRSHLQLLKLQVIHMCT